MRLPKSFALVGMSSVLFFTMWVNAKIPQTTQQLKYQNQGSNPNGTNTELKGVQFEPKSALHGLTKEHFRFSSEIWEGSDGVPIFLRREYCGSPKNAQKFLRETVKTAFTILEIRSLRNRDRETGRRIVATFDKKPPHQRVILWTNGEMLYTVESSSFAHALLFERLFPSL